MEIHAVLCRGNGPSIENQVQASVQTEFGPDCFSAGVCAMRVLLTAHCSPRLLLACLLTRSVMRDAGLCRIGAYSERQKLGIGWVAGTARCCAFQELHPTHSKSFTQHAKPTSQLEQTVQTSNLFDCDQPMTKYSSKNTTTRSTPGLGRTVDRRPTPSDYGEETYT